MRPNHEHDHHANHGPNPTDHHEGRPRGRGRRSFDDLSPGDRKWSRPGRGDHGFGFDGPGPFGPRRMRRGDIRTAVLSTLIDGPGHGYELMSRLAERSGGRWRPSPGSIYPMLQALQDEGLVTSTESDGKRIFELTPTGTAAAAERAESGGSPWDIEGDDNRHKLRHALGQLAAAIKQISMTESPDLHERAEAIITDARRKLYQLLAEA